MQQLGMEPSVLVVDDDGDLREALRSLLDACGHTSLEAGSVDEAIEVARGHAPMIVLSDWLMPGGNALDLAAQLEAEGIGIRHLIVMTGLEPHLLPPIGAASILPKPFEADRLLALLDQHVPPLPVPGASR